MKFKKAKHCGNRKQSGSSQELVVGERIESKMTQGNIFVLVGTGLFPKCLQQWGAGSSQSQEPRAPAESPLWAAGTHVFESLPRVYISGKLG